MRPGMVRDLTTEEQERFGVTTPPATFGRVPNQPKTPQRTFRIPDDVYQAAKVKAEEKGETVTDVVVRALKRYGRKS